MEIPTYRDPQEIRVEQLEGLNIWTIPHRVATTEEAEFLLV
jgi:hypothetical protein